MIRKIFFLLLWCAIILFSGNVNIYSLTTDALYKDFSHLSTDSLFSLSHHYLSNDFNVEKSMVCLSILENRYDASLDDREKELILKSMAQKVHLLFFQFFDYQRAFELINKSATILAESRQKIPVVNCSYGLVYGSLGEQTSDPETIEKAIEYLRKAFYESIDKSDHHILNLSFINLSSFAYLYGELSQIDKEWNIYKKIPKDSTNRYDLIRQHTLAYYQGLSLLENNKNLEAASHFASIAEKLPKEENYIRFYLTSKEFEALSWQRLKDYDKALAAIAKGLSTSQEYHLLDSQMRFYELSSEIYGEMNQTQNAIQNKAQYLAIKDSLLNYRQLRNLHDIEFLQNLNEAETNLKVMTERRRNLEISLWIIIFFVGIILGFAYQLWRKKRQLENTNKSLYQKNREMARVEKQERELRKNLSCQLEDLKRENSILTLLQEEPADFKEDIPNEESGLKGNKVMLSQNQKNDIITQILNVMECREIICSPDFSIETLGAKIGVNSKYVSQVINEQYNCNFRTFLNDFRIKEVCRRISEEEECLNYTLESLGESVGYSSRTTFISQFKRVTGMTPSRYISEAKKEL